jgi:hypothetical protein
MPTSAAVKEERRRLRAYLEELNRESQRKPVPQSEPTECSICRRVHGIEVIHACE